MTRGALLICCALVGCTPEFDDAPWRVDEPRVLAIAATPPEARPSTAVQLTALTASPDGTITSAPMWSVCTRPRTSSERTSVTGRCLDGESLEPTASPMVVLADACARFGPNPPPAQGDTAPQRPADPDPTGGYFLPLHAQSQDAQAFGALRIRCDLPGVTRKIFDAFEDRYVTNEAPVIDAVVVDSASDTERTITVEIPATASEPYVRYDSANGVLVDEREWLRVQWFVTDGSLDRGQETLRPMGDEALVASAEWTASGAGLVHGWVHGWVVVTDARGGVVWSEFVVDVAG